MHNSNNLSKSYKEIIKQHVFTLFNGINVVLAIFVFFTGSYRNMLFMITVILNMVIGLFQEIRSKHMLDKLSLLNQTKIHVIRNNTELELSVEEVKVNDILVLYAGDEISFDGHIISGNIECDESMLTGESDAVYKQENSSLLSGSFVISGKCWMHVDKVGQDTYAYSILKHAKRFKRYPSQLRDSIDWIIKWCTYILIPLGCVLFIKQLIKTNYTTATLNTVAAVVGMIPEGLVFLTSVALAISAYKLGKQKVLVQELYCIETLARTDTLCLDKTGTLTTGRFEVTMVESTGIPASDLLSVLLSVERKSTHPVAQAVVRYAEKQDSVPMEITDMRELAGHGVEAIVNGRQVLVGNIRLLAERDIPVPKELSDSVSTVVVCAIDGKYAGHLLLSDTLKKDAVDAIRRLKDLDVKDICLLSGDKQEIVNQFAESLGVDKAYGNLLPEDKAAYIERLTAETDKSVAFVGDGMNDAPVLALSDVGIAMGGLGSDAAIESADVVIQTDQPSKVAEAISIGRATRNIVRQNIVGSIGVKVIVLVAGAFGFATLWEAVFADVGVSLLAVLNSIRILKR